MSDSSGRMADEARVWRLLTRNFYWETPEDFGISLYEADTASVGPTRLQIFEVVVAATFARIRPDYVWSVTPNRADGGLDFVGENRFLYDETLGISAAITVGGQCKKRTTPQHLVEEVAGSLINMEATIKPTFFVVALSARVSKKRVRDAVERVQASLKLDCHILDRDQIEGLMVEHLDVVRDVVGQALDPADAEEVISYLASRDPRPLDQLVEVSRPANVLAGEPFQLHAKITSAALAGESVRVWWRPSPRSDTGDAILLGPPGAEHSDGAEVVGSEGRENPIKTVVSLEFVAHGTGPTTLGEIAVGQSGEAPQAEQYVDLGSTDSVDNTRPRFYAQPLNTQLQMLSDSYGHALAKGFEAVGVVGSGGSGKSRLAQEFGFEKRRRGALLASARQPQSLDEPHRLIADLLAALVPGQHEGDSPADFVVNQLRQYDHDLADRSGPAIHAVFGSGDDRVGDRSDQSLISALLVLIAARSRERPVVLHLQDLHWCTGASLDFLGRLIWQLEHVQADIPDACTLLLLEGRINESFSAHDWSTDAFETFLETVGCPTIRLEPLPPANALEFTRRLFEDRFSTDRRLPEELLAHQEALVGRIHQSAGGSPFHTLAQVKLLRQRGLIQPNPRTGLFFLVAPPGTTLELPATVREAVLARWGYLRDRNDAVAILLWATALAEDSVPRPLFEHLWRRLAPAVSAAEINSAEMVVVADDAPEVSFRHENYVRALRQVEVPDAQRLSVVAAFDSWFGALQDPSPIEQFRAARTKLLFVPPRFDEAHVLFDRSRRRANDRGDAQLAQRIQTASLDASWARDTTDPLETDRLLKCADDDLALIRHLREVDVASAARRVEPLIQRLAHRTAAFAGSSAGTAEHVALRQATAEALRSQIQLLEQQPGVAAVGAEETLSEVSLWRQRTTDLAESWHLVELECLQALGVAKATSGEAAEALALAKRAADSAASLDSVLADHVIGSYATKLSALDPAGAEAVLRQRIERIVPIESGADASSRLTIFLAMALIQKDLRATESGSEGTELAEAKRLLSGVFQRTYRLGQYPDAGASALMLGIIAELEGSDDGTSWFARSVAAAGRGRQLETLWRAHLNLASALARDHEGRGAASEHAAAALELMERSLAFYPEPERSPRYRKLRVPLIRALQVLLSSEHPEAEAGLARLPALREAFDEGGRLRLSDGWRGPRDYQRIEVGDVDYFAY